MKAAGKEVTKKEETDQESEDNQKRKADELERLSGEEKMEKTIRQTAYKGEENREKQRRHFTLNEEAMMIAKHNEKALSSLMASGSTVP